MKMKKKSSSRFAWFNLRHLTRRVFVSAGVLLALLALGAFVQAKETNPTANAARGQEPTAGSHQFWASTGGPQGGDGLALVTNANGYVFAGTLGGGVFRSAN